MAKETKVGRPPKMSELRIKIDPSLMIGTQRIEVPTKEVEETIENLRTNGYVVNKPNFTRYIFPSSIKEVNVKNL